MEVRRTLKTSVDKALATKNSEARRGAVTGKSANAGYRLVRLLVVLATFRGRRSTLALRNSTFLVGHSSVPARNVVHDPNRCRTTRPKSLPVTANGIIRRDRDSSDHLYYDIGQLVHFDSRGKTAEGAAVAESVLKCLWDYSGRTDSQDPMLANSGDERMKELDHERFMRRAIELAGNVPSVPFGALIVDRRTGKIVAEGWNKSSVNPTWHGEIDAINRLAESQIENEAEDLVLYTTAEPCPMCQGAILWSGIETVVYGTSIRFLQSQGWRQIDILSEEVVRRSPSWKCTLIGGVLERECNALFEAASKSR
jgi:tRNA(Arg) A34 adenosine deaminase TadA